MKKLVLIDGHHLMFRAFYGIQNLNRVDGVASNAIFGFLSMLLNIINQEQPTALAVAFDVGKSFRHQEDETYKSQRKEMDENLRVQIPEIQKMVKIAGLPVFTKEGFEADDVLGTLAKKAAKQGY
ncbi:MAG TPA: DNA polymerase I, partial [Candidatus Gracilibacteria bacterium]|nr:DNA polymerase I [Candidatus Gracilibacteria bacterium]